MSQDPFDIYEAADTQADLYRRQGNVHPGFGQFLEEPAVDPQSVDASVISNSSPEKEEFFRFVFSTRFHVVFGSFGSSPFGPGNNIMFAFDQPEGRLRLVRITQDQAQHALTGTMNVTSSSITFMKGDDLEIIFTRTDQTYTRTSGGTPEATPVYNLQARKVGETDLYYNYFVVPIKF